MLTICSITMCLIFIYNRGVWLSRWTQEINIPSLDSKKQAQNKNMFTHIVRMQTSVVRRSIGFSAARFAGSPCWLQLSFLKVEFDKIKETFDFHSLRLDILWSGYSSGPESRWWRKTAFRKGSWTGWCHCRPYSPGNTSFIRIFYIFFFLKRKSLISTQRLKNGWISPKFHMLLLLLPLQSQQLLPQKRKLLTSQKKKRKRSKPNSQSRWPHSMQNKKLKVNSSAY